MERTFHMLLYRAFHAQRNYLRPYLEEIGLGSGQPKILSYLSVQGPCHQKELAEYFEIDPAAVCRMLDSLEKEKKQFSSYLARAYQNMKPNNP